MNSFILLIFVSIFAFLGSFAAIFVFFSFFSHEKEIRLPESRIDVEKVAKASSPYYRAEKYQSAKDRREGP